MISVTLPWLRPANNLATRFITEVSFLQRSEQYCLGVLLQAPSAIGSTGLPQTGLRHLSGMAFPSRALLVAALSRIDPALTLTWPEPVNGVSSNDLTLIRPRGHAPTLQGVSNSSVFFTHALDRRASAPGHFRFYFQILLKLHRFVLPRCCQSGPEFALTPGPPRHRGCVRAAMPRSLPF